jgi:plastocyanin
VSSGTVDAGVTGVFDSGLFMSGSTFEFTFEKAGKYDYFCMVHPWMTGVVIVE